MGERFEDEFINEEIHSRQRRNSRTGELGFHFENINANDHSNNSLVHSNSSLVHSNNSLLHSNDSNINLGHNNLHNNDDLTIAQHHDVLAQPNNNNINNNNNSNNSYNSNSINNINNTINKSYNGNNINNSYNSNSSSRNTSSNKTNNSQSTKTDSWYLLCIGIIFMNASVFLLFWNEGRYVSALKTYDGATSAAVAAASLSYLKNTVISLDSIHSSTTPTIVDSSDYEGEIVHVCGVPQVVNNEILRDPIFGVSAPSTSQSTTSSTATPSPSIRLWRRVETFQWIEQVERVQTSTTISIKTTYKTGWADTSHLSLTMPSANGNSRNPPKPFVPTYLTRAQRVVLGPFTLPDILIEKMSAVNTFSGGSGSGAGAAAAAAAAAADNLTTDGSSWWKIITDLSPYFPLPSSTMAIIPDNIPVIQSGPYIYFGSSNIVTSLSSSASPINIDNPRIGDTRVSFAYIPANDQDSDNNNDNMNDNMNNNNDNDSMNNDNNDDDDNNKNSISVIAEQRRSTLVPFRLPNTNTEELLVRKGIVTADEMIDQSHIGRNSDGNGNDDIATTMATIASNKNRKMIIAWIIRGVGWLLCFLGFLCICQPCLTPNNDDYDDNNMLLLSAPPSPSSSPSASLSLLLIISEVLEIGILWIVLAITALLSGVVISIAWLFCRPSVGAFILSGILIVVGGVLLCFVWCRRVLTTTKTKKKKKKTTTTTTIGRKRTRRKRPSMAPTTIMKNKRSARSITMNNKQYFSTRSLRGFEDDGDEDPNGNDDEEKNATNPIITRIDEEDKDNRGGGGGGGELL